MKQIFILIQLILISCSLIQAKTLDDSIPAGKNYGKAIFRLWYQNDVKTIKGIIVLMPGSNNDGRNLSEDLSWQKFAQHHDFAIVACYFTDLPHENMDIENYINAKDGSGQALLDVLSLFAKKCNHKELANSPLLLWGHSGGGEFNYEFVCWKPERVIAFVVNKGGIYYSALASAATRSVPGIFFTGEKDLESRSDIVKGIFSVNRRFGALWAFAQEPGAAHEQGQTQALAIAFFNDVIPLRLPKTSTENTSPSNLLTISESVGFVGDFKLHTYVPFANWKKGTYPTSWLPSSGFADAWMTFIKGKGGK